MQKKNLERKNCLEKIKNTTKSIFSTGEYKKRIEGKTKPPRKDPGVFVYLS